MTLSEILQTLLGKVHFYITVGRKPAIEIFIEGKTIIVEVLNPFLAINAGLQMLKFAKKGRPTLLAFIKKSGYRIKIRYKRIEFLI